MRREGIIGERGFPRILLRGKRTSSEVTETPRLQGGEGYGTCEDEGRGGATLYRIDSQGTARGSRVQNREMKDGRSGNNVAGTSNNKNRKKR